MTRKHFYAQDIKDRIFSFICEFKRTHDGNSPTIRQIASGLGISSSNTIWRWRQRMHDEGRIRITPNGIEIPGGHWSMETTKND